MGEGRHPHARHGGRAPNLRRGVQALAGGQVGKGTVRDFVEVVARESHSGGLRLASGGYGGDAGSALSELERRTVRLGARAKIVSLCKTYVKAEHGLWSPTPVIAGDTLFESTIGPADAPRRPGWGATAPADDGCRSSRTAQAASWSTRSPAPGSDARAGLGFDEWRGAHDVRWFRASQVRLARRARCREAGVRPVVAL
jgi:hypothetical protein